MSVYRIWLDEKGQVRKASGQTAAVALGYDPEQEAAPRVLAAGRGVVAEKIIAVAQENQIPVVEDQALVEALASVDIGAMIPVELYAVVAEVLAYVYRLRGYLPPRLESGD
ncbi:MAG: EscU/YscU/HrcU family type III secretion system export apparatus switch protein [Thermanaerothrix sp.]|jgi:flagellar biosynthesis protein|uniref:EscU/YscU/HrcU family type III secretion system export apparatus switch protein n=1 Tax=Thermanaerothrix solaris TaxID=3058434 RepID=A0ABU3NLF3_9CHLR|nr:EscU/YscU/HrcU family type III secretion system export apparatus switch protein [Thermanaerothrix sp. 4228-RoL]MDT8897673.1 EscU/YscU/HrcU family type III secretion system export apparatus switch protein [Thermanaerothrix sp. 4228-RoL]